MVDATPLVPNSLIEFENQALVTMTISSRIMMELVTTIRSARARNDGDLLRHVDRVLELYSAVADAIEACEVAASKVIDLTDPGSKTTIEYVSADHDWRVVFDATTRASRVFINRIRVQTSQRLLSERKVVLLGATSGGTLMLTG